MEQAKPNLSDAAAVLFLTGEELTELSETDARQALDTANRVAEGRDQDHNGSNSRQTAQAIREVLYKQHKELEGVLSE